MPDGTVYLKTGDIPAEWLRDSAAAAHPYLFFAHDDPAAAAFLRGVITRQAKYILVDPHANAFRANYSVWERKWELDSLLYPIGLAWQYWKVTGDTSIFSTEMKRALDLALATMQAEQRHASTGNTGHAFTGMIRSDYRPSDDGCRYHYNIAQNMMAAVTLCELAEIEQTIYRDAAQADAARTLQQQVHDGIERYGKIQMPGFGEIYNYEVDGRGHFLAADDANIPSLLSAPYLGYLTASDTVYQNTRRFILSANPEFFKGKVASGVGSYHTSAGNIWPLALVMQALTSTDAAERAQHTRFLEDSLQHESFDANNARRFTRKNFIWPNALFAN